MQVRLELSPVDMSRLEELAATLGPSKADDVRSLLAIWRYMDLARNRSLPVYVSLDGLHVLNDSALDEIRLRGTLDQEQRAVREVELAELLAREKAKCDESSGNSLYDALHLKPGFMGFGVDLKKLFAVFRQRKKPSK